MRQLRPNGLLDTAALLGESLMVLENTDFSANFDGGEVDCAGEVVSG